VQTNSDVLACWYIQVLIPIKAQNNEQSDIGTSLF